MMLPSIFLQIGAGVVSGLVQFFASRAGAMLAGFGLTMIGVKSFQAFMGYVVADINTIVSNLSSGGSGGSATAALFIQVAAYCGLFDAVNIIISGYMSAGSLLGMKVIFGRINP